MLTITQIKALMREYDFRPLKRAGQNFLIDRNIVDKIISAADFSPDDVVIEIGAGLGNITADIAGLVKKVVAVEADKKLFAVMGDTLKGCANIELIHRDFLKFDISPYGRETRLRIVGNLPYYITTPILERLIENRSYIKDGLFMVQKEVGQRMSACPGSKLYGALSCYLGFYAKLELESVVKKTCFFPQPEVDSALIHLSILDDPAVAVRDEKLFFDIIRSAFNQRRKTLLSSLANKGIRGLGKDDIGEVLKKAGVARKERPESLGLEDFARIANEFPA